MSELIGLNAKGLKVLANRVAKKTNCIVEKHDGFIKSYDLLDKDSGEWFINIPEAGKISGMEDLSVTYNEFGYSITKTGTLIFGDCSKEVAEMGE